MAESGCLRDGSFQNLEVAGSTVFKSDSHILVRSATTAHDLTATTSNLTVIYTGTQAGAITLPQSTTSNVGLVIKIMFGADASSTVFLLGFDNDGDTVMVGVVTLGAIDGSETVDGFKIRSPSGGAVKALQIEADAVDKAGGAIGSTYTFTYYGANTVFCEARGMCTTGIPAITAAVGSITGT